MLRSSPAAVYRMAVRPRSAYVLGDSQSLAYDDRVYSAAVPSGGSYVFRTIYCPGLSASGFADAGGTLGPLVRTKMTAAGLLVDVRDGAIEATHATADANTRAVAAAGLRPRNEPLLALSCGGFDAAILMASLERDDVTLPSDLPREFAANASLLTSSPDALDAEAALRCVSAQTAPLRDGLRALRALGFNNLAVLSIPPPSMVDKPLQDIIRNLGRRLNAARSRAPYRYKIVLLINYQLRRMCQEEGVLFVNRWNDQTHHGIAKQYLLHDGYHLVDREVDASARALLALAMQRT